MSIIYEALKKVEKNQSGLPPAPNQEQTQKKQKNNLLKTVFLFLLIALIGFAAANLSFSFLTKPLTPKHSATMVPGISVKETIVQLIPKQEAVPAQQAQIQPTQQPEAQQVSQAAPKPQFVLNGIFFSGEEGYALINNRILKEGESIQGAVVKHISENGVELDLNGSAINLESFK